MSSSKDIMPGAVARFVSAQARIVAHSAFATDMTRQGMSGDHRLDEHKAHCLGCQICMAVANGQQMIPA